MVRPMKWPASLCVVARGCPGRRRARARPGETRCWIDNGALVVPAAFGDIAGDFILDLSAPQQPAARHPRPRSDGHRGRRRGARPHAWPGGASADFDPGGRRPRRAHGRVPTNIAGVIGRRRPGPLRGRDRLLALPAPAARRRPAPWPGERRACRSVRWPASRPRRRAVSDGVTSPSGPVRHRHRRGWHGRGSATRGCPAPPRRRAPAAAGCAAGPLDRRAPVRAGPAAVRSAADARPGLETPTRSAWPSGRAAGCAWICGAAGWSWRRRLRIAPCKRRRFSQCPTLRQIVAVAAVEEAGEQQQEDHHRQAHLLALFHLRDRTPIAGRRRRPWLPARGSALVPSSKVTLPAVSGGGMAMKPPTGALAGSPFQ